MISESLIVESGIKRKKPKIFGGVYFLIRKNKVVYVGQAQNIYARLRAHYRNKRFYFDKHYFIAKECQIQKSAMEKLYIQKFKPLYNFQFNPDYYSGNKEILRTFLLKWSGSSEVINHSSYKSQQYVIPTVLQTKNAPPEHIQYDIIRTIMTRYVPVNDIPDFLKNNPKYILEKKL